MRREGVAETQTIVRASVDPLGQVTAVIVLRSSGYVEADSAAVEAMRQCKFEPATTDGRAVAASVENTIRFSVDP